jgi:hypothetical protein
MKTYQYTDETNTVVHVFDEDGISRSSCLVSTVAAWIAEGNTPEPYIAPPIPVPTSVSPRQIRQALTRVSLRDAVEAAVAQGDQDLKDWWEFSTVFERSNTQVQATGTALEITNLQLDDLWNLAGSL